MFAKSEKQIKKQNVVVLGVFRSDKFSWQKKKTSELITRSRLRFHFERRKKVYFLNCLISLIVKTIKTMMNRRRRLRNVHDGRRAETQNFAFWFYDFPKVTGTFDTRAPLYCVHTSRQPFFSPKIEPRSLCWKTLFVLHLKSTWRMSRISMSINQAQHISLAKAN